MYAVEKMSVPEDRPVLYVALRAPDGEHILGDGTDVVPEVHAVLSKMATFAAKVRSGEHTGHTGRRIRNVVNIGIGGSDLGPGLASEAPPRFHDPHPTVRFVSPLDRSDNHQPLPDLPPQDAHCPLRAHAVHK